MGSKIVLAVVVVIGLILIGKLKKLAHAIVIIGAVAFLAFVLKANGLL